MKEASKSDDALIAEAAANQLELVGEDRRQMISGLMQCQISAGSFGEVAVMTVLEDYGKISGSCFFPELSEKTLEWLESDIRESACGDFYQHILHEMYKVDVDPKYLDSFYPFEEFHPVLFDLDIAHWEIRPMDHDRFQEKILSKAKLERIFAAFFDASVPDVQVNDLSRRFCLYWKLPYRLPLRLIRPK